RRLHHAQPAPRISGRRPVRDPEPRPDARELREARGRPGAARPPDGGRTGALGAPAGACGSRRRARGRRMTAARATMRAAVFSGPGRLEILERPVPHLDSPSDVVLDVEACGICGSDLQILSDPPRHPAKAGVVLGHEFVGVVADAGSDATDLHVGDRVVVAPNISCGACGPCRRGRRNHCERFTTLGVFADGGLAPKVRVPASQCHPISADLPAHVAALAEPLSTVVHGARQAAVFPGESAVVIGAGPIGLMFVALLTLAGANVVAVEPATDRAALAERLGPTRVVAP